MKDFPIEVGGHFDAREVEIAVEQCSRDLGLLESLKGTLAKDPGSVHWHFREAAG